MESVKSLIQNADPSNQISDVPIRNKMTLVVKNLNTRIHKYLFSDSIEGIENRIPVYTLDKVPYYFTDQILLQPRKEISINKILDLIDDSLTVQESTKYGTFVLRANRLKRTGASGTKG